MPTCPKGHEQPLGLKCATCGAPISYKDAVEELRNLPKVTPDFGKVSILTVGYPGLALKADYVSEILAGQADVKTATSFQAGTIRGGSWLDFQRKYLRDLSRWMALVGVDKSADRFMVVDTTKPMSVVAISALPKVAHTAVIAITADQDSTPVEQNTSYVALSVALKNGFPIIAITEGYEREMLYYTEDKGFASGADGLSRLLEPLLSAADDVMDLLEKDLKLGIKLHSLAAIVAGSKTVYGGATNAFLAQSYNFSMATRPDDYRTLHSLVFSSKANEVEFEKSFGVFRNRKFRGALNAEVRFHDNGSPVYDLLTICGLQGDNSLNGISGGYQAIVKSVPELSVEGAS